LIARAGIALECLDGARVKRDLARAAVLPLAHGEPALAQLHVAAVKRARLRHAHAGDRQQPDQRLTAGGAKRPAHRSRRPHQRLDLRLGEQVWDRAAKLGRQQAGGRHLMPSVERLQVAGEAAHDRQPLMPPHHARLRWLRRELQRQLDGDQRFPALREECDELRQHAAVLGQLVPERAAHRQVVVDCLCERDHRSLPGHGSASRDSAWRLTLAYSAVVRRSWWRSTWPISTRLAPRDKSSEATVWRRR